MPRRIAPPVARLEAELQRQARHLGAVYTPGPIVRRAVRTALEPLCRHLKPEDILRLRVLDPAVGSGRFLLGALEFLARATARPDELRAPIAASCLFGIDIHDEAVALARSALAHASGCASSDLAGHVIVADSLLADIPSLLGVPAFDAVLTNPPWISYSGRQAAALSPPRRRRLAERFASFRRWPTTHGAFLELAAKLLAPRGRAALVVPHQVCHLPGYQATRGAVLTRCRFDPRPEPLGEERFPGVVQPAAVVYLRRSRRRQPRAHSPTPAILTRPDDIETTILRRLGRHPPAPPRTFRDPGVHSGNSAHLIIHDGPAAGRAPVREGRCVHPFALDQPRRWLDVEPSLPAGRYCTIRPLAAYTDAGILVRQTADRPIAARHVEPTYFRNSVLACIGIPGLDDAVLLGLLNSTLLAFFHRCRHADSRQRAFPQVKVAHLQSLPIARDAGELQPVVLRIENLAAERLRKEHKLPQAVARALRCSAAKLEGSRGAALLTLHSRRDIERFLDPRATGARRALERPGAARTILRAVEAARRAIEPLEAALHHELRVLDQLVYRAYEVGGAQIRPIEARAGSNRRSAMPGRKPPPATSRRRRQAKRKHDRLQPRGEDATDG